MDGLVVDTSVLIAILREEPDWSPLIDILERTESVCLSADSFVECSIVLQRDSSSSTAMQRLDGLLSRLGVSIVAVDEAQARLAADTYAIYGKGHHAAALNFGDCFSYALAKHLGMPLLYKGNDFAQTDISAALSPDQAISSSRSTKA